MNRPCPDCTEKGHPGFRDPRHSDAFCRTCEGEGEIDPIQSMRDQGIADACAGVPPRHWLGAEGRLVFQRSGRILYECDAGYRSAFAYARAYEANK